MKYFFASDVHLGLDIPGHGAAEREQLFCRWLDMVSSQLQSDGGALYLLGDIFDFWFEYRNVAHMGFSRTIGRLARMHDEGLEVHFFTGNHDTWTFGYLERETGATIHRSPLTTYIAGVKVMMGHGHRLDVNNIPAGQRFLNRLFNSKAAYEIFSRILHPDAAMALGHRWSRSNRCSRAISHVFTGEEPVAEFARKVIEEEGVAAPDLFIFGHLHTPIIYPLGDSRGLVVLGQWITDPVYAVLDEDGVEIVGYR